MHQDCEHDAVDPAILFDQQGYSRDASYVMIEAMKKHEDLANGKSY